MVRMQHDPEAATNVLMFLVDIVQIMRALHNQNNTTPKYNKIN